MPIWCAEIDVLVVNVAGHLIAGDVHAKVRFGHLCLAEVARDTKPAQVDGAASWFSQLPSRV